MADLALQRRVAGEVLNVEGGEVPGKDLVGVDGLGDGVGDSIAPQDLAEGYAHLGTQYPGHCGSAGTPFSPRSSAPDGGK